jgi:hypothetical protein
MIFTHSRFYYGFEVDTTNNAIDFDEGSGELSATLRSGSYTLTTFVEEISRALNAAGGDLTYEVSVDRETRLITISADGDFELLIASGSRSGTSIYSDMGFSGPDLSGDDSYTGSAAVGSEYTTQFWLQSYVSTEDWQESADAVVNESASGNIEVVRFGTRKFSEWDFQLITDQPTGVDNPVTRNRPTGVADLRTFMQFLVTKAPFEFMADEDDVETFETLILEATPESKEGTAYKLKEEFSRGMPGIYKSGILKFRKIED